MKKQISPSPRVKRLILGLGENVKLARLRRHLSVRALAERAGISGNTLMALEKGQSGISLGVIANVLHAMGLADDIALLAKDDILGRKLQDMEVLPRKRAPKKVRDSHE